MSVARLAILIVVVMQLWITPACQRAGDDEAAAASSTSRPTAPADSAAERGFNGVFHLAGEGAQHGQSMLNITERDGTVTGMLDAAAISARVRESDSASASGEVKHPRTGATIGSVNLSLAVDTLTVELVAQDPQSGRALKLPPKTYARGAPPPVDVQLDARLVGRWRQTWTAPRSSPDEPATTIDVWLILGRDGTVQHGKSSAGGALPEVAIETTADDGFAGRWRSGDEMLLVRPAGHARWVPLARYRVDGDRLALTYHDGSQQTYRRQ